MCKPVKMISDLGFPGVSLIYTPVSHQE